MDFQLDNISLDGFELVGKQFFVQDNEPLMTIWNEAIGFSASSFAALENCEAVKIMMNSQKKQIIVMPTSSTEADALRWRKSNNVAKFSRINCTPFTREVFRLWQLDDNQKYRCYGRKAKIDNRIVLLFDFTKAIIIPLKKKGM